MGDAQFQLGLFYENGEGVAADPVEAAKWFRYSAEQGNPKGENAYGYALAIGQGVPQDLVEACKWFILASSQDKVAEPKGRAIVNMNGILPKMTPDQVQDAKNRARSFVPKRPEQPESFSLGVS
jgi:TPR repeat protein